MKKLIILSMVAMFAGACGVDAEGACEDLKDACEGDKTYGEAVKSADCAGQQEAYDELTDEQKEAADKIIECMDDADECKDKIKCAGDASTAND